MAKQLWGYDSADGFRRSVEAIRRSENDVGSNRIPRETPPVLVPPMLLLCKNSGTTWAVGATRDVNIYTGGQGSETDSGVTLSAVYNRMGSIAANNWVYVFPVNGDKLEVVNAGPVCA